MIKKIIPIIIVVSLTLPSLNQIAQAGVLDSTIGFSSCAAAGFISNLISDGLKDFEKWVKDKLTGFAKSKIGGKIGLSDRVPVYDESAEKAVDAFKGTYTAKEGVEDLIARCSAREILTAMGRNITNVARTGGRDGGVAWIRNWRNFRLGAQYRGEDIFRAMLASTNICEYFANDIKGLFGADRKATLTKIKTRVSNNDSYQVRSNCTLPKNFNFTEYKNNFSANGGWQAWSRLLEPQNNFYNSLFVAMDEMNLQRSIEEQADVDEAGQTGFTAIHGRNEKDSCAVKSPYNGGSGCLIYKDILTPSGVLSGAVVAGIETELQWVATTDELNELIATGIEVLINRLWDLSNSNEGDYIVPGDTEVNIPEFQPPSPPGPEPSTCNAFSESEGASARYLSETQTAVNEFLAANSSIADIPNTDQVAINQFLTGVASILNSRGFISGRVMNCNGNVGSDAIIVGRTGDIYGDYLDLISSIGSGDTIRNSAQVIFTEWAGMERMVGSGGGNNPGGGPFNPSS